MFYGNKPLNNDRFIDLQRYNMQVMFVIVLIGI